MKFAFAVSLIAAFACAQCEPERLDEDGHCIPLSPAEKFASLFELNEDGQWQIAGIPEQLSELPQLTWSNVDSAEIEGWFAGKMDLQSEQGQKWADAWIAYQDAITQPWNDFVTRAEELSVEDANLDMQTDEEIIRFIADNTFVNEVSLTDKFPQIDSWIEEMKAQANWEEMYNYDAIRMPTDETVTPPVVLQTATLPTDTQYEETAEPEPTKFEIAMTELEGKLNEWGYDQATVQSWFESTGASWEELGKKQDKEGIEKAQADTRVATDYVKGIFDNMVIDLKAQQVVDQELFETEVDSFIGELKTIVDEQAQENITNLDNWFSDKYTNVVDATEMPYEEMPIPEMTVTLATQSAQAASHGAEFAGYGVLAMGAFAGAYYLYKKSQAKAGSIDKTNLLEQDIEFSQV